MVTVRGAKYTWLELYAKARSLSQPAVARNVADVARGPFRRVQALAVPRLVRSPMLPRLVGCADGNELVAHFRESAWKSWLVSPADRLQIASALRRTDPAVEADASARAGAATAHQVDLLGSGPVFLDTPIDWLQDFKSGRRWDNGYYRTIAYGDGAGGSDVKVPWELSRCHQLVDLARGHVMDPNDAALVEEISTQMRSWIRANPYGMTVNWACTMEVAIRAVNWIWALSLTAPELEATVLAEAVAALFEHGVFIASNLERSEVAGNHYLSDAVGLVALGAVFSNGRLGRRWLETGRQILLGEMPRQIYADGVDHEMSIPYHRLVTEIFLTGFLILRRRGRDPESEHWARLERMLEFTAAYTRPDGTAPVWGDADDGRIQRFGARLLNDHRHLLSTGAVVFGRRDFADVAGRLWEDTVWLVGPGAKLPSGPGETPTPTVTFPDGGFAVVRNSKFHVVLDAGPVGLRGKGGHGHNDALAVEVWCAGGRLVVDPGSYVYTADALARDAFRSSAAHNAPVLEGREAAELLGMWSIADQARAELMDPGAVSTGGAAAGRHVGYTRFDPRAEVRRAVDVSDDLCIIRDDVWPGAGRWTVRWTFAEDVDVSAQDGASLCLQRGDHRILMDFAGGTDVHVGQARVSPSYGVVRQTTDATVTVSGPTLETRIRIGASATTR